MTLLLLELLHCANYPETIEAFARATDLEIANETTQLDLKIANSATNLDFDFATGTDVADVDILSNASEVLLDIAGSTNNLQVNIGNPSTSASNVQVFSIGGGFLGSSSSSLFIAKTNQSSFWGDVGLGVNKSISDTLNITTQFSELLTSFLILVLLLKLILLEMHHCYYLLDRVV